MTDTKKEVSLVFTGDTTKLKQAMAESRQYMNEMQSSAKTMSKQSLSGHKSIAAVAKKVAKSQESTHGRKAMQTHRKRTREIKQQNSLLSQQAKIFGSIGKAAGGLKNMLGGVVQKMQNLKRSLTGGGGSGGGRGGSSGGRRSGGPGFGKTMMRGLGGIAMGGIMGLLGGFMGLLTSQLSQGYSERTQYGRAYGNLAGTGGRLRDLNRLRGFGTRMGMGPIEMAGQALPFARATGVVGGGALRTGMAFQRASALNAGESAQFMGMLTQAGQGFGGRAGGGGRNQLIKTLALGVHSGLDRARMPEFFGSVTQLVQRQMTQTAGNVDASQVARLLSQFGQSGMSGLQGARGGQVLGALDQAIRRPGGGEAGQALMLQAMGFGKPGGGASYYEALRKQERGVFGEGNLEAMFSETRQQYGGGQAQILALRTMTGLTIDQLEAVRKVVDSNMTSTQKQEQLNKIQEQAKSIEEQALDEMKEFGDTTRHIAELQNRSIGIGDQIKEAVEDIQHVINEMISRSLPAIKTVLETIAEVIGNIWSYLKTWIDPQFTAEQRAAIQTRFEKAEQQDFAGRMRTLGVSKARSDILMRQAEESRVGGVASQRTIGLYQEAAEEAAGSSRLSRRSAAISSRHAELSEIATDLITRAGEDGISRRERQAIAAQANAFNDFSSARGFQDQESVLRRIEQALTALREAVGAEGQNEERRVLAENGRALINAVEAFQREQGGTGSQVSTRRPTTSGL